jgi:general stress protein 26
MTDEDTRRHFEELIAGFGTAMLVTRTVEGRLRARPLTVAGTEGGRVYFSTSVDSPKMDELAADAEVAVTFQSERRYASLSGTVRSSRDRRLIHRLWKEAWKVWFPEGKDDPHLTILIVTPEAAEYWDLTGLAGARYVLRSLKAYVTGATPADGSDPMQNAKVPF